MSEMDDFDLLVAVDLQTDNSAARAATESLLAGHGWDVTQASESPNNRTLLLHQTTGSPGDQIVDLDQMGINVGSTRRWLYQRQQVLPYLGDAGPESRQLYSMLASSSDATKQIRDLLYEIPDWATSPGIGSVLFPSLFPGDFSQGVQSEEAASDTDPSLNSAISIPESAYAQTGGPAAHVVGAQTDHELRTQPAVWPAVSDLLLFSYIDQGERGRIAASVLSARYGIQSEEARKQLESTRAEIAAVKVETAKALKQTIDQWRSLARIAPLFMAFTLLISIAILVGSFLLTKWGKLDGYQFSVVIFMSAVFVLSPATLLLLERPLRGVDAGAVPKVSAGQE
jgi:hypothetical protein